MNNRRIPIPILLVIVVVLMSSVVVMSVTAAPSVKPACPTVVQQGELKLTIPAGHTSATAEQPFIRCAGLHVQASGGTPNRIPVIINAVTHHDQLLLTAGLLAAEPGPTEVTIWWRVD